MRRIARLSLASLMLVALPTACADVLGLGAFGDQDASVDAGDASASTDSAPDVIDAQTDADAGCVSENANDSAGIFVATSGSTDVSTCGTKTVPCASVQAGLDRAHVITGKSIVYVARGTYAESITLYAGLRIAGGWDVLDDGQTKSWVQACADRSGAVVIQPATSTRTAIAIDLGGTATIADLTLRSKQSAAAGESLYGVFARGATTVVALESVVIDVGAGGDGTPGASGAAGDAGASGCSPDLGDAGTPGNSGTGAEAGAFGSDGWVLAAGSDGTIGTPGVAGMIGVGGACVACGVCKNFLGCSFNTNGAQSCGGVGFAGCGGAAGGLGTAGTGGGSSVAVFAWDATVTIDGSDVRAANGGSGGNGGLGGEGGPGGAGARGDAGAPCGVACNGSCGAISGSGAGGDAGTSGGAGGSGGNGGGGAGGCAFALFQGGTGAITTTTTTLTHGDAGAGGGPDGSAGANGLAAAHYP